jgi:signal transduction histidine kinase
MPQPWTKIYFQVEDSGEGIPLEYLPKVFLPFEQTNSNQSHTEGVGLDLVISQKLVELLGASIRVQSTVGQGTIFEFEIECPQTVLLS